MKRNIGPVHAMYPSLTTIVGVMVDGRPNFSAIAHVGIMNHGAPQYLSVGINKAHHSGAGIKEHGEFSICVPGEGLMVETDYVGLVSGRNTDKSGVFELFWGGLKHAPLIAQCPVCMEMKLDRVLDFERHEVFVGEIVATHVDEAALDAEGKVDIGKVKPLLFDMASTSYWSLGRALGQCWSVGKDMKRRLRGGESA